MLTPAVRGAVAAVAAVIAAAAAFAVGAWAISLAAGHGGLAAVAVVLAVAIVPTVCVWAWRDPRVSIGVVLATMPLPFAASIAGLQLQPVEVAIGFALVITVASRLSARSPLRMPPAAWWLVLLVVWAVVATAGAANVAAGVKGTISLVEGVVLIIVAYNVVRSIADVRWVIGVLVGVAALVALPTLLTLQQMTVRFGGANVGGRAAGLFKGLPSLQQYEIHLGPNQFGAYMSVALFGALALAVGAKTPRRRLLATVAMLPIFGALVASLSRGAWIGAAVGAVFVLIFAPPARRVLLWMAAAAVLVGAVGVAFDPSVATAVHDRFDKLTVRGPYDRRPQMWVEAARQIVADPLTGSGPANYRVVAQRHGLGRFSPFHAHNFFLTWAAEAGLPAVALLLAFCVAFARAVWSHGRRRSRRSIEHAIVVALTAAPVAFLVHGMVHYTSQHFALYAVLGVTLGACELSLERRPGVLGLHAYGGRRRETNSGPTAAAGAQPGETGRTQRIEHATSTERVVSPRR